MNDRGDDNIHAFVSSVNHSYVHDALIKYRGVSIDIRASVIYLGFIVVRQEKSIYDKNFNLCILVQSFTDSAVIRHKLRDLKKKMQN